MSANLENSAVATGLEKVSFHSNPKERHINFPVRTAFAAFHRFWVVMFLLSFVSRNVFISLLISSVTCLLFRNVLFNLQVFVFLTLFLLVIDIWSYSIVVREDAWYDFNFLKLSEVWFVTQDMVCPGKCSMCAWEEGVFFCIWMGCPEDISEIHLI